MILTGPWIARHLAFGITLNAFILPTLGEGISLTGGVNPLRYGISSGVLVGVNENDARAALRVLVRADSDIAGIEDLKERILKLGGQLRELAVSPKLVATLGFFRVGCDATLRAQMISTAQNLQNFTAGQQVLVLFKDRMTDVYVVSTRVGGGIADIEDLRGRSLILCNNPKMRHAS